MAPWGAGAAACSWASSGPCIPRSGLAHSCISCMYTCSSSSRQLPCVPSPAHCVAGVVDRPRAAGERPCRPCSRCQSVPRRGQASRVEAASDMRSRLPRAVELVPDLCVPQQGWICPVPCCSSCRWSTRSTPVDDVRAVVPQAPTHEHASVAVRQRRVLTRLPCSAVVRQVQHDY